MRGRRSRLTLGSWIWLVLTKGPSGRSLAAIAREETGTVRYLSRAGFWRSQRKTLAEASLLVVPSISENFGIVVAEGLAHGLPVITTTGTPWEVLARERCGWWVTIREMPCAPLCRWLLLFLLPRFEQWASAGENSPQGSLAGRTLPVRCARFTLAPWQGFPPRGAFR